MLITCPVCTEHLDDSEYLNHLLGTHFELFMVWVSTLSPLTFTLPMYENGTDNALNINATLNLATLRYIFATIDAASNNNDEDNDMDGEGTQGVSDMNKVSVSVSATALPDVPDMSLDCAECPICLDALQNTRELLVCRHRFCSVCIERWCEKHKTCPVCVRDVTVSVSPVTVSVSPSTESTSLQTTSSEVMTSAQQISPR
jgi:hypothetical protein